MSTADLEVFGPPDADGTYPRFTTVLRGYDPDQVRDYILQLASRVDVLERELAQTRAERDAARQRYGEARDDAYDRLGQRMADMLRIADRQSEKIKREAEDEAKQRVTDSKHLAQQIEREAEEHGAQIRADAEEALQRATDARQELLGGLTASRDLALADLAAAKDHIGGILERLEIAMELARAARIGSDQDQETEPDDTVAKDETSSPEPVPQVEDILVRTEGFEIMVPEFLLNEEEEDRQE